MVVRVIRDSVKSRQRLWPTWEQQATVYRELSQAQSSFRLIYGSEPGQFPSGIIVLFNRAFQTKKLNVVWGKQRVRDVVNRQVAR